MSFSRYPKYKDSGVEWLGEVPEHWENARLRWLSTRYSGGTPDKQNLDYWTDGNIPWINSGAVNQLLISEPSAYITEAAFKNSSAKWIPAEALVMALAGQGKTKGMVAQLVIPTTCNQSMAAIIPNQELAARFLFWWLTSNYQNIRNMAGGDLRDGLNLELLGDVACPLAPFSEQRTIAAFLDRETAKMDALVAEQEKLIAILKEKRQAVISHAVTKGLDPSVPMKDSGVEWLGEVPEGWEVRAIKHILIMSLSQCAPSVSFQNKELHT
ncbi:MAG: restriction endonuclease subunit S [Ferrovum myxofaciens]